MSLFVRKLENSWNYSRKNKYTIAQCHACHSRNKQHRCHISQCIMGSWVPSNWYQLLVKRCQMLWRSSYSLPFISHF